VSLARHRSPSNFRCRKESNACGAATIEGYARRGGLFRL